MTSREMPIPQGDYVPARRERDLIMTAGMTPRRAGVLIVTGAVDDARLAELREPVELACANALAAVRGCLQPGEAPVILAMKVFVAAAPGFVQHSRVADFASGWLRAELGAQGICARSAIGVASLPGNAPVEIELVATV